MVSESSWFNSLRWASWTTEAEPEKLVLGILAFEVTSLMSKVVHLWQCLSDEQVDRIRDDIINSDGVRKLVSEDDVFILSLVCGELMENLGYAASAVGRLGKRSTRPILQRFEQVFDDLVKNDTDVHGLRFTLKKMERKVKKMGRLIAATSSLYQELEVLAEDEQVLRRMQVSKDLNRRSMQQKVAWKRLEVKNLREVSLWSKSYDYTVRLLARSLFTIFEKIKLVFQIHQTTVLGVDDLIARNSGYLPYSQSSSALMQSAIYPSENNLAKHAPGPLKRSTTISGPVSGTTRTGRSVSESGQVSFAHKPGNTACNTKDQSSTKSTKRPHSKTKRLTFVGPLKGCMLAGSDSPILQSCAPVVSGSLRSGSFRSETHGEDSPILQSCGPRSNCSLRSSSGIHIGAKGRNDLLACANILHANLSLFCSKRKVLNAPPSTLSSAALALHYAKVIIAIEKLVESPHLIGSDARDDLYDMLPTSLRVALRARLKSYTKKLSSPIYDTNLAAEWSKALNKILEWLAPLAHNMIRWQSERNFEQQHLISRNNVLLVQTLHFADQAKTEAVLTELLVGLNYLCRFYQGFSGEALLKCTSKTTVDDCLYLKELHLLDE